MTLKELRTEYKISQLEAASIINIPERTYRRYELDENYGSKIKREAFITILNKHFEITEKKGLLTLEQIKEKVIKLFETEYKGQIDYCYLFGSYAVNKAHNKSDVDLLVDTTVTGMAFFGLAEALRETLHKKIDLLNQAQLKNNPTLIKEILMKGIRIYVRKE